MKIFSTSCFNIVNISSGQSSLVCVLCERRLNTAENLLEHISNEHGITLWRVSEEREEHHQENVEEEKEVEDDSQDQQSLLPLELSVRLLQLKWLMNNQPPPMEPSARSKGCVITGRNTCEFCGKVFVNLSNLTVHRRSHTGEKPYQCNVCDYTTAQSSKLTRHMKIHKKHKCDLCNETFVHKSDFNNHLDQCHVQAMIKIETSN